MKKMRNAGIHISYCFYLLLITGVFISCVDGSNKQIKNDDYITLTDDLGRTVKLKKNAHRFLPLAPSVTEMLYAICDTSEIIGRTPYCNFPSIAKLKPEVNNYPPDLEKILSLKPDLVITKDGMLSLQQAEAIEKMGIPVYFQKYYKVADIFIGLEDLAIITNHEKKGKLTTDSLRADMNKIADTIKSERKKVLMLISKESYFAFGKDTYASDIVRMAGAVNAVDSIYNNPYPILSAEYILKVNPDVIIGGEAVGLDKDFFELHKELKRTKAYKTNKYFTVNDDYLSRPGPRVVEAVKTIKTLIK